MNWFEAFFKRLNKETPKFFKNVIAFGITLGTIGIGIIAAKETVNFPYWLLDQADNMIIIGAVAAIIAKSTVKDPNQI